MAERQNDPVIAQINETLKMTSLEYGGISLGGVSDGYHTFDELYEHRIVLFIKLLEQYSTEVSAPSWRSKVHSDGSVWNDWFILGWEKEPGKQITYHLPIEKWDMCDFVNETLKTAPPWDGHTSADVLERLKKL